jgi:hypothetical protein
LRFDQRTDDRDRFGDDDDGCKNVTECRAPLGIQVAFGSKSGGIGVWRGEFAETEIPSVRVRMVDSFEAPMIIRRSEPSSALLLSF